MPIIESLRIDQAEPVQGTQYPACQGLYSAITGMSGGIERCKVDPL
jgi:hypothetical protein